MELRRLSFTFQSTTATRTTNTRREVVIEEKLPCCVTVTSLVVDGE